MVTILLQELVQNVAIIGVDLHLVEAHEHVLLEHQVRVDERRQLLREVNRLVHGDLSGLLAVLAEDHGHRLDVHPVVLKLVVKLRVTADLRRELILAQLGQQLVQTLHTLRAEDLVQDTDLARKVVANAQETNGKL